MILIDLSGSVPRPQTPQWCLYIVNGPSETLDIWSILKLVHKALQERLKYGVICRDLRPETPRSQHEYNSIVFKVEKDHYFREEFERWLTHLTDLAKWTTHPKISPPVQLPQTYEGVPDTSVLLTLPIGEAQTDISRRSASPHRLDTEPRSDVDEEVQITFTRSLDPKSKHTQGNALRKRQSDVSDETYNVEPGPSKRLKTGFDSDTSRTRRYSNC